MPWTRTRSYPHAFAVPEHKRGGSYNYMTYVMFDQIFWRAMAGQVNRWRKNELHLDATTLDKLHADKSEFGLRPPASNSQYRSYTTFRRRLCRPRSTGPSGSTSRDTGSSTMPTVQTGRLGLRPRALSSLSTPHMRVARRWSTCGYTERCAQ